MEKYIESYKQLYEAVYSEKKKKYIETQLSNFVTMKGKRYDEKIGKDNVVRFMLVGRATNGWGKGIDTSTQYSYVKGAVELFEQNTRFETEWGLKDGENNPYSEYYEVDKDGNRIKDNLKKYYLSKSPFWDAALKIYQELSKNEDHTKTDWYEDIVWSNIYKVAPLKEGNPSSRLIYAQAPACVKLLKEEIRILKPTHILMVVDESWLSWAPRGKTMFDFKEVFDGYERHCLTSGNDQEKKIVQQTFTAESCKVLVTCRPEFISRESYINSVLDAFNN